MEMARGQLNKYLSVEFRRKMQAGDRGLSVYRWIQSPKRRGTRAGPWTPASKCGEMMGSSKEAGKGPVRPKLSAAEGTKK